MISACSPLKTSSAALTPTALKTEAVIPPTPTQVIPDINVDTSKLKGIQIFFMHPFSGDLATLMDNLVNEFNQTNTWGIHVVDTAPGSAGSLYDTLTTEMQNSIPPEIIVAPVDELMALNQNSKTIADLTPYVNSPKWGLDQELIKDYLPAFWNQDDVAGFRYGIPAQRSAQVMIYNKTWATQLGFANPPTTPEEFQAQVCAAHASLKLDNDPTNDGLGGWIIDTDAMTLASWATSFGTPFETAGELQFSTPEMVQTLSYLRNLLDKGCAWNSKDISPYNYFANRETLIYSADLQDLSQQQTAQQLAGSKDEWMVIPYPTTSAPFILTEGSSYAILTNSPEKQLAAWLFIRWMSSLDNEGAVVKASTTLPLGENFINYSIELEDSLPQWKQAVDLLPDSQITPLDANWSKAKMVLEDAAWQLFKTGMTSDQIPDLTNQIDQTLAGLSGKTK